MIRGHVGLNALLLGRMSALVTEQAQDSSERFEKALLVESSGAVPGRDDAVPLAAFGFNRGREVEHSHLGAAFVGDAAPAFRIDRPLADAERRQTRRRPQQGAQLLCREESFDARRHAKEEVRGSWQRQSGEGRQEPVPTCCIGCKPFLLHIPGSSAILILLAKSPDPSGRASVR